MSSKNTLGALTLVAAFAAQPASAQSIAYINALQFDLQSFRNQATAGVFMDDIDKAGDATRLLEIEGNRIFSNLSNVSEPALSGDRLLTYGLTQTGLVGRGSPIYSSSYVFDSGSFLGGWIGRTNEESENVFSVFYQSNGLKSMTEDLEDLEIDQDDLALVGSRGGSYTFDFLDAEIAGSFISQFTDADSNYVISESEARFDLKRFNDESATDFDFGWAREMNADLSVGARVFFERNSADVISEGTVEFIDRDRLGAVGEEQLLQTARELTTYTGPGEDAFKQRDMGVSLNADLHQWQDQSLNIRLDVSGTSLTNPSLGFSPFVSSADRGGVFFPSGNVNKVTVDDYTTVFGSDALGSGYSFGNLDNDHENRVTNTFAYFRGGSSLATESVDDERSGLGIGAKLEYDRACAGGDSRTWVAVARRPYDIDATIVQRQVQQNTFWWNGSGFTTPVPGDFQAVYTTLDESYTTRREGDMNWTTMEGGARWTKDLSNTVSFGGGLIATRTKNAQEFKQTSTLRRVQDSFDDGNGTLGNDALEASAFSTAQAGGSFNERQTLGTGLFIANVDDEQKVTTVRIPVGLQFHFAQKWTWNMGSLHSINWINEELNFDVPEDGDAQVLTAQTFYDGTTANPTPQTSQEDFDVTDETIVDKTKSNTTAFFYGLEWDATENLSFNINGMFESLGDGTQHPGGFGTNFGRQIGDVDFWRSLAVSVKVLL